jgi:coenzyme F420 hydrogenase subunit beta
MWQGCSGRDVPLAQLNAFTFGVDAAGHEYLGFLRRLATGYAVDERVRRGGASGGILTAVLLWLLERGAIQGAVVTGMDEDRPWLPRSFIATTPDEVRRAAQSKYVITSVNEILPEIARFQGALAYVGLPCQVHSLRKLQRGGDPAVRNIKYVLGPYCGNTLHFSSIRTLLRSYGVRDHREVTSLSFREGEWPGNLHLVLSSGRTIELPKFHANYLIPFHIMKRCLLCTDLANELTDLSAGDAWAPVYEERGKGFSVVVARSDAGGTILRDMEDAGRLCLSSLGASEAVRMHSHGFDLKKRGAFIRIALRRRLGRDVPVYGYEPRRFPPSRYVLEVVIVTLFALLGTRPARWCLERISPRLMGRIFARFRTLWKKSTRSIKTRELEA